jgi:hypothetical protein
MKTSMERLFPAGISTPATAGGPTRMMARERQTKTRGLTAAVHRG